MFLGSSRLRTVACLVALASCSPARLAAQSTGNDADVTREASAAEDDGPSFPVSWLEGIWGTKQREGVAYLPVGFHAEEPGDIGIFHLTTFVYKSVYGAVFRNTYDLTTYSLGLERSIANKGRFHLAYRLGVMAGYDGILSTVEGIPFRNSFLFEHNVNPIFGFPAGIDITDHVQFEAFINPFVTLFGLKVIPGE